MAVLFTSLVQSWWDRGKREKQMIERGREVGREGAEGKEADRWRGGWRREREKDGWR